MAAVVVASEKYTLPRNVELPSKEELTGGAIIEPGTEKRRERERERGGGGEGQDNSEIYNNILITYRSHSQVQDVESAVQKK